MSETTEREIDEEEIAARVDLPRSTLCRCGAPVTRDGIEPVEDTGYVAAIWSCRCGRTRYDLINPETGTIDDTEYRR